MVRRTGVYRDAGRCRRRQWGALLLGFVILAGCAGAGTPQTADQVERLRTRVARYWDARLGGDLLETYRLHPPAFRKAITFSAFAAGRGAIPVLEYEIKDVRVNGPEGVVVIRTNYTVLHKSLAKPMAPRWGEVEEQWVMVSGEWYRKFRFPMGDPYAETPWNRPDAPTGAVSPPTSVEAPAAPAD